MNIHIEAAAYGTSVVIRAEELQGVEQEFYGEDLASCFRQLADAVEGKGIEDTILKGGM